MPAQQRLRRPTRVECEVYDPRDGVWLVRFSFPYSPIGAAHGGVSRLIRRTADAARKLGRPDGKALGFQGVRTRTTLHY
jgi:hypothetical protein